MRVATSVMIMLLAANSCEPQARRSKQSLVAPIHERSAAQPEPAPASEQSKPTPEAELPRVAITFDDLGVSSASSSAQVSRKILQSLEAQGAPVAVFANCQALDTSTLSMWQRAGATIGNHTATHLSIEDVDSQGHWHREAWWQDVKSCDRKLATTIGEPVRYFRFPYLRYGVTEQQRTAASEMLEAFGYRNAHVTAATSEWLLAQYYDTALAKQDQALARDLAKAYVEHMLETLAEARRWANEKVRRDVAQITLFHVNALAADHLGEVLSAMRSQGWQFVSLAEALADPVYALPDVYTGRCGCSWLARIEPPLEPTDVYFFRDAEEAIEQRFEARVKPAAAD
jgi:peptidoglycan/xylan/chitin deacetylase (PgdA/CDA1 family)